MRGMCRQGGQQDRLTRERDVAHSWKKESGTVLPTRPGSTAPDSFLPSPRGSAHLRLVSFALTMTVGDFSAVERDFLAALAALLVVTTSSATAVRVTQALLRRRVTVARRLLAPAWRSTSGSVNCLSWSQPLLWTRPRLRGGYWCLP